MDKGDIRKNSFVDYYPGLGVVSTYRNAAYGASILWILVFHGYAIYKVDYSFNLSCLKLFHEVISWGNAGVDSFLFLSGISLYFSYAKNPDRLGYYAKRFARIAPSTYIVYCAWWFTNFLVIHPDPGALIGRLTLLQFWMTGDETIWFVSLILVMYALYPLIYRYLYDDSDNHFMMRSFKVMILAFAFVFIISALYPNYYAKVEIALTRIPVFLFGCVMGKLVFENRRPTSWWMALPLLGLICFVFLAHDDCFDGMARRFILGLGGVSIAYCFSFICYGVDLARNRFETSGLTLSCAWMRACDKVGAFSLELYLTHVMLTQVFKACPFYQQGSFVQYLVLMVISIPLAYFASKQASNMSKIILAKWKEAR